MKTNPKHPLVVAALIVGVGFILAGRLAAQTLTTLHDFDETTGSLPWANQNGAWPTAPVLLVDNLLYGTTAIGGPYGCGIIYALRPDGTGFTNLYSFNYANTFEQIYPKAGLLSANNLVYGTDCYGGLGYGSIFSINKQGGAFQILHTFPRLSSTWNNTDGAVPSGELVLAGDTFYGATAYGGITNAGTLYAIKTNGTGFRVLHQFTDSLAVEGRPKCTLVLSPAGGTLFGTAGNTVFTINTDGSGYRMLHQFTGGEAASMKCGLVLSSKGTLYGVTESSFPADAGRAFAMNTDGSGYRVLHRFPVTDAALANVDGAYPVAALILSPQENILYGTTSGGGVANGGTLFALNTDGTGFAVLHDCSTDLVGGDNTGGFQPNKLILAGKTLYGTAGWGGGNGEGTVFSLALGLSATISASPTRAQIGDSIEVVVNVFNAIDEVLRSVRLDGGVALSGASGVASAGFRGPTMVPSLAPGASANFTYLYKATNYGAVTFTATATGMEPDGAVTRTAAASATVTIAPRADLMVKSADPGDTVFGGVDEFQPAPPFNDQDVSLAVSSKGVAAYTVRLKNDEAVARAYVLRGVTNNIANWAVKALAGNVNIFDALISPDGWTTPQLAPGAYLDLQVTLAPLPEAGVADIKWIQITALADSASTDVLDALRLHATLVRVPVKVTVHKVGPGGYSPESVQEGLIDINAPLVPSLDPNVLANSLTIIHGGLVADGVTPLVIKLEADHDAIGQFGEGLEFVFQASVPAGENSLTGDALGQRFARLQNGSWQSATSVVLSASSPIAYVELLPILSDDLVILYQPPGVKVDFGVQDKTSGIQAGDVKFALQKPPIALVHGYASTGNWGVDFKAALAMSRPYDQEGSANNFICTVKYMQDYVPGLLTREVGPYTVGLPVLVNTVAPLADCAQILEVELNGAMLPLHSTWAFTRFDVVAHSQGGVLSRMLCNTAVTPTIAWPFRNERNFNRGRFHRVVTIGSPHNGSRLLHYLLDLDQQWHNDRIWRSWFAPAGALGVFSQYAQPKFDPFLEQIRAINDPLGPWWPDPAARFHLVRMTIDGGNWPSAGDWTPSYVALGLTVDGGGLSVIPGGSDGIVDFASMGAQDFSADPAANVFTFPKADAVSHAEPIQLFNAMSSETASPIVANHVIFTLDQRSSMPPGDIVFGPFPRFPRLGDSDRFTIDHFAETRQFAMLPAGPTLRPHAYDADLSYQYQLLFPSNLPPVGDITWFVQVYDASGITSDGVALAPGGPNGSEVGVTVDGQLVGDVVLQGFYLSGSNTMVAIPPTLVVSLPPSGATLTGLQLLPASIALPLGTAVSPQLAASYSDGSSCWRYAAPGTVKATSSRPEVVSVEDPLSWQLSSVGTAQINVTWSGFTAASQITVFDPTSNLPPTLSLLNTGSGQLTAAWAGYKMDYVLESSGDLQQTNSWQPVATAPASGGGWTTVALTMTNTQQFFRLRWDPSATQF